MADIKNLDANTQAALNDRMRGANELAGNFQDAQLKGQIKQFTPTAFNYGGTAANSAIQRRADAAFGDNVNKIQKFQEFGYPAEAFKKSKQAEGLGIEKAKFDYARMQALRARKQQEEAQRSQLLGSILGLGGAVIGFYAGGPAGAVAGAQAGQAAGGAMK